MEYQKFKMMTLCLDPWTFRTQNQ